MTRSTMHAKAEAQKSPMTDEQIIAAVSEVREHGFGQVVVDIRKGEAREIAATKTHR